MVYIVLSKFICSFYKYEFVVGNFSSVMMLPLLCFVWHCWKLPLPTDILFSFSIYYCFPLEHSSTSHLSGHCCCRVKHGFLPAITMQRIFPCSIFKSSSVGDDSSALCFPLKHSCSILNCQPEHPHPPSLHLSVEQKRKTSILAYGMELCVPKPIAAVTVQQFKGHVLTWDLFIH